MATIEMDFMSGGGSGMKTIDLLGELTVTAASTYQSKTLESISGYTYLYFEFDNNGGVAQESMFMPTSVFKGHNSSSSYVGIFRIESTQCNFYYTSDTTIMLSLTRTTDKLKVYGIK